MSEPPEDDDVRKLVDDRLAGMRFTRASRKAVAAWVTDEVESNAAVIVKARVEAARRAPKREEEDDTEKT